MKRSAMTEFNANLPHVADSEFLDFRKDLPLLCFVNTRKQERLPASEYFDVVSGTYSVMLKGEEAFKEIKMDGTNFCSAGIHLVFFGSQEICIGHGNRLLIDSQFSAGHFHKKEQE